MENAHAAERPGGPLAAISPARLLSRRTLQRHALLIVLGILTIALSVSTPAFFTTQNILNLLDQVAVIGIVACGMTVVMIAGGFDLSVGAVVALSAVVIAIAAPLGAVAILLGLAAAAVVGLVNGALISRARVNPFVVTLGMLTIIRGLSLVISNGHAEYDLASWFAFLGDASVGPISWGILSFVVVAVLCHLMLRQTRFGRTLYALGSNEEASWLAGINTGSVKTVAYVISAALAGFAGLILAGQIAEASPISGTGYELQAIAAVIIGGTRLGGGAGTIIGTVVGALMLGVIDNGLVLLGVAPYWQGVVQGGIIIAAVALAAYEKQGGGL